MAYDSLYNPYSSCRFRESYNDSYSVQSNRYSKGAITGVVSFQKGAIKFNGTSGKITRGFKAKDIKSIIITISPVGLTKDLIKLSSSANIKIIAGVITLTGITGGTITVDGRATSTVVAGKFQKVVISTATDIVVNDLQEGFVSGYYDGLIDLFEMYNVQYFGQ